MRALSSVPLPVVVLVLVLVASPGCSAFLPTPEEKLASFEPLRAARVGTVPLERFLGARIAAVIVGTRPIDLTGTADAFEFTIAPGAAPPRCVAATPVSADGYLLTAAHCVAEGPLYVVGLEDGRWAASEARVAWTGDPDSTDADLAVIHVDARVRDFYALAAPAEVTGGATVVSVGFGGGRGLSLAAGRLLAGLPPRPAFPIAWITHDAPLTFGDSGGALATASGRLVGINVRTSPAPFGWTRSTALRPDPAWLGRLLETDRRARRAGPARGG